MNNTKTRFFSSKYIMYHTISISDLSKPQLSKLLKGKPVRVKLGDSQKINVSTEQKKKMMSAHKKGKGINLTFDPYQMRMHGSGMKGKGPFDWLDPNKNGVAQAFAPIAEPIKETFTPQLGRDIAKELIYKGIPIVGSTLGGIAGSEFGPVGSMAGAFAGEQAGQATANKIGELSGLGVRRGRPKKGGALMVAGYKGKGDMPIYTMDYRGPNDPRFMKGNDMPIYTMDHRGPNDPRFMKGSGNFWEDIAPATTYLRPVGDALVDKTVEKIRGSGMRKMKGKGNFWEDISPATTYLRPVGDALVDKTVEKIKGSGMKGKGYADKFINGMFTRGSGMRKGGRQTQHGLYGAGLLSSLKKGAAKALNLAQTNPVVGAVATQLLDQIPTAAKALGSYAGDEKLGSMAGHMVRAGIKAKTGLGLKKKGRKKKGGALMVAGLK